MSHNNRARDWVRPQGVPPGNWEYINDASIASGYDQSLEDSPLVLLDQKIIQRHLPDSNQGVVIDFGCGTGRNAIPLLELGWKVVGVDLSSSMLEQFSSKLNEGSQALLVQSNLIELDGLDSNVGDFGQCMFSTFGMIQSRASRNQFLRHVTRVLKPPARFIIHGHNYWHHLRLTGGVKWLIQNAVSSIRGRCELGDRFADYRTVNQMMLHHFSLRSLRREILQAGMKVATSYAILPDGTFTDVIRQARFGKAVGWVLVCEVSAS